MGVEKATLSINSKPLIRWAYDAATRFALRIYVSVHDEETITHYSPLLPPEATFVKDVYDGPRSALLALLSGFTSIEEETIAVIPTDSPFVSERVMTYMVSRAKGFDLVVPMWPDGKVEAIHAIYSRLRTTPILQHLWSEGTLEVKEIPKYARTLFVGTENLQELDPSLISLVDADTPGEFQSLRLISTGIH
jgi:molybdopterin-guanine dinucleotide biosynthesis protein A